MKLMNKLEMLTPDRSLTGGGGCLWRWSPALRVASGGVLLPGFCPVLMALLLLWF